MANNQYQLYGIANPEGQLYLNINNEPISDEWLPVDHYSGASAVPHQPTLEFNPTDANFQYPVSSQFRYQVQYEMDEMEQTTCGMADLTASIPFESSSGVAFTQTNIVPQQDLAAEVDVKSPERPTPEIPEDCDIFESCIREEETRFGKWFYCLLLACSYQTDRKQDAKRHYNETHAHIKPYACVNDPELLSAFGEEFMLGCKQKIGGCLRSFARKEHLKNHLKRMSPEERVSRQQLRKMASTEIRPVRQSAFE